MHIIQIRRHHLHGDVHVTHTNTDTSIPCTNIHRHTADTQRDPHITYATTYTQHAHIYRYRYIKDTHVSHRPISLT